MNHPIGSTQAFESIIKSILQVANTPLPVLLTGETGVGKGVFAHYLHQQSTRCDKPFHVVNCGSIAAGVLESELFGHEKGAFSGALSRRIGLLEHADGGTVLLDEINSATPELQVRLLDFIQLGSIKPVGSNMPIRLDVRLVFATNQPLEPLVAKGSFRADLFYRMHVFPIDIPPLRQRKADIPLLVAQLLNDYAQRFNISIPMIESEAMQVLIDYAWPGNVRQLENVVQRLLVSTSLTGKIGLQDLPNELLDKPTFVLVYLLRYISQMFGEIRWVYVFKNCSLIEITSHDLLLLAHQASSFKSTIWRQANEEKTVNIDPVFIARGKSGRACCRRFRR